MIFAFLAITPFLLGYVSRSRFDRSFTTLAILFALGFFCLPAVTAASEGRLTYLNQSAIFTTQDFWSCMVAMAVFASGFGGLSIYLKLRHRVPARFQTMPELRTRTSILTEAFFALFIILMVAYLYRSNFHEVSVSLRQHAVKANYAISTSMLSLYFVGSFYLIKSLNNKKISLSIFWFASTLALILVYGGRLQTILVLVLPFLKFFKRLNLALIGMCFALFIFFPIIIGGKQIIAAISNQQDVLQTIMDLYFNPVPSDALFNNFAHPLASYFHAPELVDKIGYRLFWDIPQGVLFYLQLVGIDFGKSLTYFNTKMLLGIDESVVPPGYLAFGYIQANFFGVFVMGSFFRFTGSFARYIKDRVLEPSSSSDFFFAFLAANTFYIGEIRGLVLTFFAPCMLILLIGRVSRLRVALPARSSTSRRRALVGVAARRQNG